MRKIEFVNPKRDHWFNLEDYECGIVRVPNKMDLNGLIEKYNMHEVEEAFDDGVLLHILGVYRM